MTLLLIQISIVLLIALLCGWIARSLGQAKVVGEIIGGILIGPSVFGRIAPNVSARMFPEGSLSSFETLSTIGLILFLFLIGTELDYMHLRRQRGTAVLASSMSILFPFIMSMIVAPALRARFAPPGIRELPFNLFLGISMSITAFPVLARMLEERRMQGTPLGTTALMCAAVDDVCAWTLLAVALTLIPHKGVDMPLPERLLALVVFLAVMFAVIRPLGAWYTKRRHGSGLSYELLGIIIAIVMLSAATTEAIGVHPLFGAFVAGLCFPRVEHWQTYVRLRLDMVISVILLPLFFALTGLRTRLDLLSDVHIWFWAATVLAVAITGKIGGAALAARWSGQSWKYATALGALLNTRGLVELIVLNIAFKAHVFSPTLFTMLVVMALVTTMMTTPILNWLGIDDTAPEATSLQSIEAA